MVEFKVGDKFTVNGKTYKPNSIFQVTEILEDGIKCIDLKDHDITAIDILPQIFRDFQLEAMKDLVKRVK